MFNRTTQSVIQLVLAFIGMLDAGTLYFAHRANVDLPCTTGGGCDLVAASHWAYVYGVPVALLGTAGYIIIVLMSVLKLYSVSELFASSLLWLILAITAGGTAFSWYLQYVAAVDIGAFCIYCRGSAIIMSLLFLSATIEGVSSWKRRIGVGPTHKEESNDLTAAGS
jgi:uncharacterized membrane protein